MVGRLARPDRFRPRVSPAGSSSSRRRAQPEPNLHSGLRTADEQLEMGLGTGQRQLIRAGSWTAKRFGRQRVANHFSRQIPADGTRRKTSAVQVGVTFFGD
jgi:hypothetical protein